ncbi:MAG TPA: arsenite methyltransferase [Bacteroidota bacterium]|nr:arsenite methyltransferase [Bacteroidota bacterium]
MKSDEEIKENVREMYSHIALGETGVASKSSCCGPEPSSCCGSGSDTLVQMSLSYHPEDIADVPEGANLGLGCGVPTAFADLKEGSTVLDLGSGAGIDVFVAARYVGASGKAIGVDMTPAMIDKAKRNAEKISAKNVEFRLGEIEALPVDDNSVDRVISNCVINLVPSKAKAFDEIYRVLKNGGTFTVSDIVIDGSVTDAERNDAALWAGCISGAIDRKEYLDIIANSGFTEVKILAETTYDYKLAHGGLSSITISGTKR